MMAKKRKFSIYEIVMLATFHYICEKFRREARIFFILSTTFNQMFNSHRCSRIFMNNEIRIEHRKNKRHAWLGGVKIRDITLLFHRDIALYV